MKICISEKSIKDFVKVFKAQAALLNKDSSLTKDQIYKSLYNAVLAKSDDVNDQHNKDVALQHMLFIPVAINGMFDNVQTEIAKDLANTLSALNDPKAVTDLIKNYQSVINTPVEIEENPIEFDDEAPVMSLFNASHYEILTNQTGEYEGELKGKEKVLAKDRVGAFTFIREILDNVLNGNIEHKVLATTLGSISKYAADNKLELDRSLVSVLQNPKSMVFAMTDVNGNIISKDGKIVLFNTYTSATEKLFENYKHGEDRMNMQFATPRLREAHKALTDTYMKASNISLEEASKLAKAKIIDQLDEIKRISKVVSESEGKGFLLNVDLETSNFGFIQQFSGTNTDTKSIKDINNFAVITQSVKDENGKELYKFFGLTGNTLHTTPVSLYPKTMDSNMELVNNLIDILTNPSLKLGRRGFNQNARRHLFKNYVNVSDSSFIKFQKDGSILVGNRRFQEEDAELKTALYNYFTTYQPKQKVTPDANSKIVNSVSEATSDKDILKTGNGEYYSLYKPKFSFAIKPEGRISITDGVVTLTPISHDQHLIENSYVTAEIGPDNDLRLYHPRIGFTFGKTGTVETTVEENNTQEFDFDDEIELLAANTIELDEISSKAEEAAIKWFQDSPLSKALDLNITEERHPHALAQWFTSGIMLYKGSNNTLIYHEAWHAFTQGILSKADKDKLYAEVRNNHPNETFESDKDVEEFLAEKFRAYAMNKELPKGNMLQQYFKKIMDFLKNVLSKKSLTDKYFKQLSTGKFDISKYNPQENMYWGRMNANIKSIKKGSKVSSLSTAQSKLILDTVNTLVNQAYSEKLKSRYYKIKSVDQIADLYAYAKKELKKIKAVKQAEFDKLEKVSNKTPEQKMHFTELGLQVEALAFAITNFGSLNDIESNLERGSDAGVIASHITKGTFISEDQLDALINEEDVVDESDPFKERKNISLGEYADSEVLLLMGTIPDFDSKNNAIENGLGVQVLAPKIKVLMKVGKLLMSKPNEEAMFNALKNSDDRMIKEVLLRLPVDANGEPRMDLTSQLLWSKFFQTFNKSNMPLRQLLFERVKHGDKYAIEPKYGNVSSSTTQVERDWSGSFENTPFVKHDIHGSYLDVPAALEWLDANKDATPAEKLNAIGISITDNDKINKVLFNGDASNGVKAGLVSEFINRLREDEGVKTTDFSKRINGVADLIKNYPSTTEENGEPVTVTKPGLRGYYNKLKEVEFMHSDNYNSFMGTNAEGETASELVLNSSITHMTNNINSATTLEDLLSDNAFEFMNPELDPFKKANNWMNALFNEKGEKQLTKAGVPVKINYENFSGTKLFEQIVDGNGIVTALEKGLSNMALDKDSKFITDVYLSYFNKSEVPRMADKSSSFHFGLLNGSNKPDVSAEDVVDALKNSADNYVMYDFLKGYLAAEIVRINTLKTAEGNIDKAYKSRGQEFFIFDDLLTPKIKTDLMKIESTNYEEILDLLSENEDDISQSINNYFKVKTELTYAANSASFYLPEIMLKELGVKTIPEAKALLFGMYERNKFLHNLNFTTMFLGDPALYDVEKGDFHKRIAGIISTGESFRHDKWMLNLFNSAKAKSRMYAQAKTNAGELVINEPFRTYDGTVNTAVINDHVVSSEYLDELRKVIPESLAPYEEMTEADGQGFISFDFYRMLSISQGLWTPVKEAMYNNIVKGEAYDQTKVSEFFESMKLQYYGPVKSDVLSGMAFHKFNLIPLVPSMIKGTKLEILHNKMMEQGIDYMTFASGSKLSTISNTDNDGKADDFYSQNRDVNKDIKFTKNITHVKYLKNQIKIHNEFKGKVTLPTQMRTILYAGLMNSGVPTDVQMTPQEWEQLSETGKALKSNNYKWVLKYEAALKDIADFKRKEVFDELGITDDADIAKNNEKLVKLIRKELTRSEIEDAHIDFLFNRNALKQDISMAFTYAQVEKMLVALIDKRMTKIKVNGEGLIQMASTMSEKQDSQWKKATLEEQLKYGTNGLRSYHLSNGKIQGMEVKIALQGDFEKLLYVKGKDGKTITEYVKKINKEGKEVRVLDYDATLAKLNELMADETWREENKKLFTLTTSRIPGQAMNSLEFMVVKEFLPKHAGNIIMVPSEMVAKSGSDFDVDKLFTMMPNLGLYNGSVELIERTAKEDEGELKSLLKKARTELKTQRELLFEEINKNKEELNSLPNIKELRETVKEYKAMAMTYDWDNLSKKERKEKMALDAEIKSMVAVINNSYDLRSANSKLYDKINSLEANVSNLERRLAGQSIKGLENNLISVMVERLEREDNFPDLVRPNSNDLVDYLADDLEKTVSSFNSYQVVHGETRMHSKKKGKEVIAKSMIFDPSFNINKQIENAVGMDTLGIGAIINKYYSMFTRIGMYTNVDSNELTYKQYKALLKKKKRTKAEDDLVSSYVNYKLHFPNHNTKTINGKTVTDLSGLKNSKGEYIPDILGQMINGWVDVAKGGWIFNIQGNKEAAPTLEFLFMAGVPVEDAVYFMSLPIIRKFLDVKRKQAGALYALTSGNVDAENIFEKNNDLDAYVGVLAELDHPDKIELIGNALDSHLKSVYKSVTDDNKILSIEEIKNHVLNGTEVSVDKQLEWLNKFMMYMNLSGQITSLTTSTTFDTKSSSTLNQVRKNQQAFRDLNDNTALPADIKKRILDHSAIGPFESMNMITELFKNFAVLRNNNALLNKASKGAGKARKLGIQFEDHLQSYQDEFLNFLYQNEYNRIDETDVNGYQLLEDNSVKFFSAERGILRYNPKAIQGLLDRTGEEINEFHYSFGSKNALLKYLAHYADTSKETFLHDDIHYKLAKQALTDPSVDVSPASFENVAGITDTEKAFEDLIQKTAAESKALLLSGNRNEMMKGHFSYAKRMLALVEKYGELKGKFDLLKDMRHDYNRHSDNIRLSNIKEEGYAKIYKEDLEVLKQNPIPEVQELFSMFDRFATLQSGATVTGRFNLNSIIDPAHLSNVIGEEYNIVVNYLKQASEGKIKSYDLLNLYDNLYYGTDIDSFKSKIWARKRGASLETDSYFKPQLVDGNIVTLEDMPDASRYELFIAANANKAVAFPTGNGSEMTDIHYEHYNALASELLNTNASENETVFISAPNEATEDDVNKLIGLYSAEINKNINVPGVSFIFKADKGLNTPLIKMLTDKGFVAHKIVSTHGSYVNVTKKTNIKVEGNYNTYSSIDISELNPIYQYNDKGELVLDKDTNLPIILRYDSLNSAVNGFDTENSLDKAVNYALTAKFIGKDQFKEGLTAKEYRTDSFKLLTGMTINDQLKTIQAYYEDVIKKYTDKYPEYRAALLSTGKSLITVNDYASGFDRVHAVALMRVRKKLKGIDKVLPKHTVVDEVLVNNKPTLAKSNPRDGIIIRKNVTPKMFFDYVYPEATAEGYSAQKQEMSKMLEKEGYPEYYLKFVLDTPGKVQEFLIYHEESHLLNSDTFAYDRANMMAKTNLEIETRASIDALVKMGITPLNVNGTEDDVDNGKVSC